MNIDLEQIKNIDLNDVARWPKPFKVAVIVLICIAVLGMGLWFDTRNQLAALETSRNKEQELKNVFKQKAHQAANLGAYKAQMEEMKRSFGAMLRQLPSKTEVAELLVDISQTGLENGLEFELFKPQSEKPVEFYSELPIKISVTGRYHEFGKFISDVAALPRIVTLQDFSITPLKDDPDTLVMEVTAKTYRYLDEEEVETLAKSKKEKKK
ncbi:MAG TPA: pilus assembly protein PilO [Chromatiales bacterium]|nr:pilus assembly protein PilO [Chromatiales bacterium]